MTPAERADPKIINGSRRLRIANGSGVTVGEVNDLVDRFFEARKMMKQMAGQFGFGSRSATKRLAKSRQGQEGREGQDRVPGRGRGRPPACRTCRRSRRACASCPGPRAWTSSRRASTRRS